MVQVEVRQPGFAFPAVECALFWVAGLSGCSGRLKFVLAVVQGVKVWTFIVNVKVPENIDAFNRFLPVFCIFRNYLIDCLQNDLNARLLSLFRLMIEMYVDDETLISELLVLQDGIRHTSWEFAAETQLTRSSILIEPDESRINHEEFVCEIEQTDLLVIVEVSRYANIAVELFELLLNIGSLMGFGLLESNHEWELLEQLFTQLKSINFLQVPYDYPIG